MPVNLDCYFLNAQCHVFFDVIIGDLSPAHNISHQGLIDPKGQEGMYHCHTVLVGVYLAKFKSDSVIL